MSLHRGSCHCERVRFEFEADIERVGSCDCSICTKKGILHVAVPEGSLRITAGEDALSLYRFGSEEASHWFCRHCGIHTHGRPRMDPSRFTVNARCLDDFDDVMANAATRRFDGRNHPKDRVE